MPQDFCVLFGWRPFSFGSKMINQSESPIPYLISKRPFLQLPEDRGREALRWRCLKNARNSVFNWGRKVRKIQDPKKQQLCGGGPSCWEGSWGKALPCLSKGLLSKEQLLKLLHQPIDNSRFKGIYYEILRIIESFPEPFASKTDKL